MLFRFLKKHHFELPLALESLLQHLQWRLEYDVAHLQWSTLSPGSLLLFEKRFSCFLNGRDACNRPILFLKPSVLTDVPVDVFRNHLMYLMEIGKRFLFYSNQQSLLKKVNDKERNPTVFQLAILLDLQDFGWSHFVRFFY